MMLPQHSLDYGVSVQSVWTARWHQRGIALSEEWRMLPQDQFVTGIEFGDSAKHPSFTNLLWLSHASCLEGWLGPRITVN